MPALPMLKRALAGFAAAGVLAGCGGGEGESTGGSVTVGGGDGLEVIADEYSFDPSTIAVEGSSGPLEITLVNRGSIAHNLRVFDDGDELGGTATFPGGETRSARLELEPGAYRMVCTVADHEALGMVGEIEVR
jgi:plastocyanin